MHVDESVELSSRCQREQRQPRMKQTGGLTCWFDRARGGGRERIPPPPQPLRLQERMLKPSSDSVPLLIEERLSRCWCSGSPSPLSRAGSIFRRVRFGCQPTVRHGSPNARFAYALPEVGKRSRRDLVEEEGDRRPVDEAPAESNGRHRRDSVGTVGVASVSASKPCFSWSYPDTDSLNSRRSS